MGYNDFYEDSCSRGSRGYRSDRNDKDCECDSFFKNISRGEDVKVFLKGGGHVSGEFINFRRNIAILAKADCHHHHHDDCDCKKDKVKIITICCDDIVAVEV